MIDFAIHVGKKAGSYIRENIGSELQDKNKGRIDLVTRLNRHIILFQLTNVEVPACNERLHNERTQLR